ncbi:hypothetical protein A5893_04485 [Pedobacter psychrophilus]|uniref:DUF4840 domain-containing protein n=1 Tax=Pedobacter psychrophilus TaxID=1826909 RepID=A0A179DPC9_9SPHI|nr:hypothetical protein [Pedobacter psychrophilus]OAQ42373.1 hypothetical protein A5893_04485 [Pedobacter psychrophilus]
MKKSIIVLFICIITLAACKKDAPLTKEDLYPDTPTTPASSTVISTFYNSTPFYELFIYRFDPVTAKWTNTIRSHFPTVPSDDPSALGFTNPYVAESGVALFDMVRLYTTPLGSSNIKSAKINVPKVFRFFPDFVGAKTGVVKVIEQDVVLTKADGTTFKIGISGQGTYDERTKIFNIEVTFNETAIGGANNVKRKYSFSVDPQTLN